MIILRLIKAILITTMSICAILPLIFICFIARLVKKTIDVGIGPEPLINNIYHKKALTDVGFTVETFVSSVYFITDKFDIRADIILPGLFRAFRGYYLFLLSIFRYKCIYIYFTGGALGHTNILWRIEPFLYRLAGVKIVVMPYGGDVHDLTRTSNLEFKNAMSKDYPRFRLSRNRVSAKVDLWTKYASHVISGCDWVEYMFHWDSLMLGHFSIDTDIWKPYTGVFANNKDEKRAFKILHAPNHRTIKGTKYFINSVEELKQEGFNVELVIIEKVSNDEIRKIMAEVDIVADQLIVGWYAMFAIEAMAMGKPVLCYLREDFENLYMLSGLIEKGEIPIINCKPDTVKEIIRNLIINKDGIPDIGRRSREYVIKHHSLDYIGSVFKSINNSLGIG